LGGNAICSFEGGGFRGGGALKESDLGGDNPDAGISMIGSGMVLASSCMDGSEGLFVSDVRRESGGERYPDSPRDGRRASLEAKWVSNGITVVVPEETLYELPNSEPLVVELLDDTVEDVE